ncbi:GroES-like protein [Thelephora ganbajun]|uniref:GroES-like protein n=1 Tax=Thelephora ganbajun TaxID=370292 RepID=A0ACB6ZFA9_THEGA|nr:GroES-like protein [Thelephora ganbajun]
MSLPKTVKAVVVQENKTNAVQEVPIQSPGENEILVKVGAVAINPTDWKHTKWLTKAGTYIGCDFAGEVVRVGPNLKTDIKVGDKVASSVRGGVSRQRGAFPEYAKASADLTFIIPEDTWSIEEASTIGIPLYTSIQALYGPKTLRLPQPGDKTLPVDTWFFVYGGSSSVGQCAIQLAKLSGYKVATVASPHNFELAKNFGADIVFDYKDPNAIKKLKEATGNTIHLALDAISLHDTHAFTVRVLGEGYQRSDAMRRDVDIIYTLIYTAFGVQDGNTVPDNEERQNLSAFIYNKLPGLVKEGKIKPNAITKWEGGLERVPDAIEHLAAGKVSGEKIVFSLQFI